MKSIKRIYMYLKNLITITLILLFSILYIPFAIAVGFLSPAGKLSHLMMKYYMKTILFITGIDLLVQNLEYIKKEKQHIFVSNHLSHFDIGVISAALPKQFLWMADSFTIKIPFIGWYLKVNKHIFVDRKNSKKTIPLTVKRISKGHSICMFPEGKMSRNGSLESLQKGIYYIAKESQQPIIPIHIEGTYSIMPHNSFFINPRDVILTIGKEIPPKIYNRMTADEFIDVLQDVFMTLKAITEIS